MENKQKILTRLCEVLRQTDDMSDLISLTYLPHEDAVIVRFENGRRRGNVALDSGTAMIRDVVNNLGC